MTGRQHAKSRQELTLDDTQTHSQRNTTTSQLRRSIKSIHSKTMYTHSLQFTSDLTHRTSDNRTSTPSTHGQTYALAICSRNRVLRTGSKIHYLAPNPHYWYEFVIRFFPPKAKYFGKAPWPMNRQRQNHLWNKRANMIVEDMTWFGAEDFIDGRIINTLRTFYTKNLALWRIFDNCVCRCHCIVVFPYLLKSWNRVQVRRILRPATQCNVANHC